MNIGADLDATLRAIRSGKVTDEEVNKLMTVFHTSGNFKFNNLFILCLLISNIMLGVVSTTGGVVRIRKLSDLRNTLDSTNRAFDTAMEMAANREGPQSK